MASRLMAACLVSFARASPWVLMETQLDQGRFVDGGKSDGGVVLELTFALHQPVALLQELLASVSSPDSPSYGGYLSFDDVGEIVRDASATAAVIAWLDDSGAETTTTPHGEYVKARAPVVIFNALLNADFRAFHDDGRVHHRALEYSLPAHVAKRVSHVFGATHLPPAPRLRTAPKPLEATALALQGATPQLLNSYYNIKSNDGGGYGSQSLYESLGSNFSPSDLIKFQEHFGLPTGEVAVVLGGHDQSAVCDEMSGSDSCGEANLDVQYIMSIAQNVETWFWYAETNSSFTDWAFAVASRAGAPLVHSISYGTYENGTARSEIAAFDVEAMKLGLRGITVVVASGDDGSANYLARDHPDFCQGYWPSWPASSPYVVSVGATQGPEAGSAEIACSVRTGALITSGGGFSDVVDRPAYQDKAVRAFLDQPKFTFGPGFNAGGRGYPDVSMLGHDYPVIIGGTEMHFDGTSASAPVFAGVLALVNSDRLSKGQPSVGFANPVLYALAESHPGVFHDIVKGSNECPANVTACCANVGFYATPGWDAVTGLGSVNVAKLVAAWPAAQPLQPTRAPNALMASKKKSGGGPWVVGNSALAIFLAIIAALACATVGCAALACGLRRSLVVVRAEHAAGIERGSRVDMAETGAKPSEDARI